MELALLCLLHEPEYSTAAEAARDRSGGGGRRQRGGSGQAELITSSALTLDAGYFGVSVATVLTQGLVAAGLAYVVMASFNYAFKLGNSHHRNRGWVETLMAFGEEVVGQSGLLEADLSCIGAVLRRLLACVLTPFRLLWRAPAEVRSHRARKRAEMVSRAATEESAEAAEEALRLSAVRARRIAFPEDSEATMTSTMTTMSCGARRVDLRRVTGQPMRLMPPTLDPRRGIDPPPASPRRLRPPPARLVRDELGRECRPRRPSSRVSTRANSSGHTLSELRGECLKRSLEYSISDSAQTLVQKLNLHDQGHRLHFGEAPESIAPEARAPDAKDGATRGEFGLMIRPPPPIQLRTFNQRSSPPPSPPAILAANDSKSAIPQRAAPVADASSAFATVSTTDVSKAASVDAISNSAMRKRTMTILTYARHLSKLRRPASALALCRTLRLSKASSVEGVERPWTSATLPRGDPSLPGTILSDSSQGSTSRHLSHRWTRRRHPALERSGSNSSSVSARALVGKFSLLGRSSAALFAPSAMRVQKAKQKDGSQVAVLALAALRQKRMRDAKWRSGADRFRRLTFAWAFTLGVSFLFITYALIVSLKFGERETTGLFASWGAAYLYGTVLLEPGMLCLLSAMPCLTVEETRFGRFCLRIKWCWDELLSP